MRNEAQAVGAAPLPRALNGSGRRQLVAALLESFDRAGLERVTSFALDEDLEEIAGGENLRETAFNLVAWARDHGRLDALVTGSLAENPNSPALAAFVRDIWSKPSADAADTLDASEDREAVSGQQTGRGGPARWGIIAGAGAIALVIAFIGLRSVGILGNRTPTPATPQVTISNATLRQVETNESGDELLNIAYDLALTNAVGVPVRIEAVALDAASRRPVLVAAQATPQEIRAERADDRGIGSILVPFPMSEGCIVVRVAALDDDGDELSATATPGFDPYDAANPTCPGTPP